MASYQAQHIQFENWAPQEVANWLQGLDESVAQYVGLFQESRVDGRKLLMLNHADLEKMGISKLGHQELVLEAVDLLRALRYTLDTENLQSMALQLGCKARNVVAEIQMRQGENDQNRANLHYGELHRQRLSITVRRRLSITVLSYVADLLTTLKNLVSWLDRAPFEGIYDICRLRNSVVKLGLELVTVTQRESACVDPEGAIKKSCGTLIEYCEGLVQNTKDPLVIQPAALEQATIRKKQGEELGMNIQSAYNGIHGISSIKDLSPADMCSKIEKGDEVLQVNGQTVLGWQLRELVKILKDKPKEVTLLLKKRPRHIHPLGAMHNHKKLAAKHAQQAVVVVTLPKSLKKRRSRDGEAGLKQGRPSLHEFVVVTAAGESVYVTKDPSDTNDADGNDTDNEVFRSGSESPQYTLPVMPDAKQRRATVSGGSPTFERNSLMVDDPVIRPKSQALNKAHREATLAVLAASENNLKSRVVGGEEEGLGKVEPMWRKTSSESSSGQKGPSESEMEDSVFSSDKEDKEQQNPKKPEQERQEFRVTKPTPILLEPAPDPHPPSRSPTRRTSSSSSVSSTTSSSTLINSPHTAPKLRAPDTILKVKSGDPGPEPRDPKTRTTDAAHTPADDSGAARKYSSPSSKSQSTPRKPSFTSMFTRNSSRKSSSKSKSATDSGKKTSDSGKKSGDHGKKTSDSGRKTSESGKTAGTEKGKKTSTDSESGKSAVSDNEKKPSETSHSSKKSEKGRKTDSVNDSHSVSEDGKKTCAASDGEKNTTISTDVTIASDVTVSASVPGDTPHESSHVPLPEPSHTDSAAAADLGTDKRDEDSGDNTSVVSRTKSQARAGSGIKPQPLVLAVSADTEDRGAQTVSQDILSEVATDMEESNAPQLIKVTKLSSPAHTNNPSPGKTASTTVKLKKRVDFSPQTKDTSSSEEASNLHMGSMVQKSSGDKSSSSGVETSSVRMRQKSSSRRPDRRVSCKDLGQGDCEGWLFKRKEKDRTLSRQWHKRWCILKSSNLYYYKNKEELRAEGVIYMPAFQVSPAPGLKTRKFAFKIHNSGTTFYFASERQEDMSKWMNKMGLAAISFDTSNVIATRGFSRLERRGQHLEVPNMYYSESDDDPEEGAPSGESTAAFHLTMDPSPSTSQSPPIHRRRPMAAASDTGGSGCGSGNQAAASASVKENSSNDLHTVLRAIHSQDLTIDGVDRRKRRTRHLSSILGAADGKTDSNIARLRKLLALKRTVKVKEQELQDIERLLASQPTASRLRDFIYSHPDIKL